MLMTSQNWPADKLRELQWSKLEKMLCHAYETCDFYRQRFNDHRLHPKRDFKDFDCLSKLPILTKTDIQQSSRRMTSSASYVRGLATNATGGSTGMPLNFFQDDNYRLWADAARIRAWRLHEGVSRHAVEAVLWGAVQDVGREFSVGSVIKDVLRYRTLQLNTFDLDDATIRKFFRFFNFLRPQILRGYASSLHYVANYISEHGLRVTSPRVIISSAEMLWPKMRERISSVFSAPVINSYGCREVSQIATECLSHDGLHIVMENNFVEVEDGQILVTNLNNLGMPFIRYQVGDLADGIATSQCRCGRQAYRLIGLKGRDNENISLPSGKVINGEFFEFLFFGFASVEQFQVIYCRLHQRLLVRVSVSDASERIDTMLLRRMHECFGFDNVKIEFTKCFEKTPSGKFKFVYSVEDCMGRCVDVV